jgi:hypothetical protein
MMLMMLLRCRSHTYPQQRQDEIYLLHSVVSISGCKGKQKIDALQTKEGKKQNKGLAAVASPSY